MKIILASKSGVRKEILKKNNFDCTVIPSGVDEDQVKDSLLAAGADPTLISKNLAELKSIKVSNKNPDQWPARRCSAPRCGCRPPAAGP